MPIMGVTTLQQNARASCLRLPSRNPQPSRVRQPCGALQVVCNAAPGGSGESRQARFLAEVERMRAQGGLGAASRPKIVTNPPPMNGNSYGAAGSAAYGQQQPQSTVGSDSPGAPPSDPSSALSRARSAEGAGLLSRSESSMSQKNAKSKFILGRRVEYGQRVKVVGSDPSLGKWQLDDAPEMKWSEGDKWHVTVDLPAGSVVEYKYVIMASDGKHAVDWQWGNNNVLALKTDDDKVEIVDNWDCQPGAAIISNGQKATREARLAEWASQMGAMSSSSRGELRRTRMELAAAQEEARIARADSSRLKAQLARTQTELLSSERQNRELQRTNQALRAQLAESSMTFHKAFETAQRLLAGDDDPSLGTDRAASERAVSNAAAQLAASANVVRGADPYKGSESPGPQGMGQQGPMNGQGMGQQDPMNGQDDNGILSRLGARAAGLFGQQQQQGGVNGQPRNGAPHHHNGSQGGHQ